MSALTAELTLRLDDVRGNMIDGASRTPLAYATADTIYSGGAVGVVDGAARPFGVTTGSKFLGICSKTTTFTNAGTAPVSVNTSGPVIRNIPVAGVTAATDKGRRVYLTTDNFNADCTLTRGASDPKLVGEVYAYRSSGYADVLVYTPDEINDGAGIRLVTLNPNWDVSSSTGTVGSAPLPGSGRVLGLVLASQTVVAADATNKQTFLVKVGGTSLTPDLVANAAIAAGAISELLNLTDANAKYSRGSMIAVTNTKASSPTGIVAVAALVEIYGE